MHDSIVIPVTSVNAAVFSVRLVVESLKRIVYKNIRCECIILFTYSTREIAIRQGVPEQIDERSIPLTHMRKSMNSILS